MSGLVSAARNVETLLLTQDMNKDIMLQKLQNRIHFEKMVAASNAPTFTKHCTMAIPAWFVAEHGDKFRQSVLLWSEASTESWRVALHLAYRHPCSRPEIRVTSGWRAFATANSLVAGDSLIFCIRAMSEFDVYVFRKTRSPIQPSLIQRPRKRSNEKVNTLAVGCRDRNPVHESSEDRLIADIIMGLSGGEAGRRMNKTRQDRKGKIFFEKTLPAGAVSARFQLSLPKAFVQQHGDKIRKHVVLQSVEDRKKWTVKLMAHVPRKYLQVAFWGGNWKAFVVSNGLVEGDRLTFTLVAMSKFEVLIHLSGGNAKAERPSVQRMVKRSKGESAFSQTWHPPKYLGPQRRDLTGESSVKLERESSSELFAEKGEAENSDGAYSASDSASQISPSDMDSRDFERWCQGMSMQEAQSTNFNETDCHAESQNVSPTSSSE